MTKLFTSSGVVFLQLVFTETIAFPWQLKKSREKHWLHLLLRLEFFCAGNIVIASNADFVVSTELNGVSLVHWGQTAALFLLPHCVCYSVYGPYAKLWTCNAWFSLAKNTGYVFALYWFLNCERTYGSPVGTYFWLESKQRSIIRKWMLMLSCCIAVIQGYFNHTIGLYVVFSVGWVLFHCDIYKWWSYLSCGTHRTQSKVPLQWSQWCSTKMYLCLWQRSPKYRP